MQNRQRRLHGKPNKLFTFAREQAKACYDRKRTWFIKKDIRHHKSIFMDYDDQEQALRLWIYQKP